MSPAAGRTRSVLVVANDGLPYPGCPVSGSGLRAWGLGQGLAARGHSVRFAMPETAARPETPAGDDGPVLYAAPELGDVIRDLGPEVVVFQHWVRVPVMRGLDIPVALDLHGPLMIESAFQHGAGTDAAVLAGYKVDAFERADFITCAGEKQRQYFLAWLITAGGDPTSEAISVIPVSLPPESPEHDWTSGETTFVYGGTFLPWQDPTLGLETLVTVLESEGSGRLDFYGAPHPEFETGVGVYEDLAARLGASARVAVHGLRPRDDLIERYRHASVAVDVMARNNERELAFTTRTVEYLWCGLPVVYHDYGELSPLIAEYDAGWIVPSGDRSVLEQTFRSILDDPEEVRRRGRNAQRLARERLNWERTIDPLDAFCRAPTRASRVAGGPLLVERRFAVELEAMRATKTFRAIDPLRRLYARLRGHPHD